MQLTRSLNRDVLTLGGLVPFSTGDFPGRLSAVLFTQGCPLRCRYCHNPHLRPLATANALSWESAKAWLRRRRGLLDAVVISGGEPTIHGGLVEALTEIRTLGFATGLHSSGANPNRLAEVVPLLDWVGFDFKAPFARYAGITGSASSGTRARRSLHALLGNSTAFEIRTTVHPALLTDDDLLAMAAELRRYGVRRWVLQRFRATGCEDPALRRAAPLDGLERLMPSLQALVPDIVLR
jgi:pyruvate formate lyase activating enzyme